MFNQLTTAGSDGVEPGLATSEGVFTAGSLVALVGALFAVLGHWVQIDPQLQADLTKLLVAAIPLEVAVYGALRTSRKNAAVHTHHDDDSEEKIASAPARRRARAASAPLRQVN